jgi:uncharacterized membrane protein HdeD (DUF308 family)
MISGRSSELIISHTVSVPELLWTLFCLVGLIYSTKLFRRAVGNLSFLRDGGVNHTRSYSATTTIWTFSGMMFSQFVYVLIGIIAMLLPASNNVVQPLTFVITISFVCSSAIMSIIAYIIEARKEQLIQMLIEFEKERQEHNGNNENTTSS